MSSQRFTMVVATHLFLMKEGKVLLSRRFNTGYQDGNFSVPAGHVDENETVRQAMIREAQEEIGIEIQEDDLQFAHVMHRITNRESIDFFFVCQKWQGEPEIKEVDKCDLLEWHSITNLPKNTIGYIKEAISNVDRKEHYAELGWE